jgi:hypothetical protein
MEVKIIPESKNTDAKSLYLMYGKFKTLPKILNVEELRCNNNKLRYLPHMPNLVKLWCHQNRLKTTIKFCRFAYFSGNKIKDYSRYSEGLHHNKFLHKIYQS